MKEAKAPQPETKPFPAIPLNPEDTHRYDTVATLAWFLTQAVIWKLEHTKGGKPVTDPKTKEQKRVHSGVIHDEYAQFKKKFTNVDFKNEWSEHNFVEKLETLIREHLGSVNKNGSWQPTYKEAEQYVRDMCKLLIAKATNTEPPEDVKKRTEEINKPKEDGAEPRKSDDGWHGPKPTPEPEKPLAPPNPETPPTPDKPQEVPIPVEPPPEREPARKEPTRKPEVQKARFEVPAPKKEGTLREWWRNTVQFLQDVWWDIEDILHRIVETPRRVGRYMRSWLRTLLGLSVTGVVMTSTAATIFYLSSIVGGHAAYTLEIFVTGGVLTLIVSAVAAFFDYIDDPD